MHKGAIGSVVAAPPGTDFLRQHRKVDKSKRCYACGGPTTHINKRARKLANHTNCTGIRKTIGREKVPCECPCRLGLQILDPNL